ncbi:hypothetical protein GCM10010471_01020 [Leucobacter komagatae]
MRGGCTPRVEQSHTDGLYMWTPTWHKAADGVLASDNVYGTITITEQWFVEGGELVARTAAEVWDYGDVIPSFLNYLKIQPLELRRSIVTSERGAAASAARMAEGRQGLAGRDQSFHDVPPVLENGRHGLFS